MVTQHIATSQIPTRWKCDIMIKGENMTQSNPHHTHILMFGETLDDNTLKCNINNSMNYAAYFSPKIYPSKSDAEMEITAKEAHT